MKNPPKLPLAKLEENGGRIESIDDQVVGEGAFVIVFPSGRKVGPLAPCPDPYEAEEPSKMTMPVWCAQVALSAPVCLEGHIRKVNGNKSLSEFGKAEALREPREEAVAMFVVADKSLRGHEAAIQQLETKRYAVPELNRGDIVGALRDKEIRDGIRAMNPQERGKFLQLLNTGENEEFLHAVIRSPLKTNDLEQVARIGWNELIDRRDPIGLANLNMHKASIEWSQRIMAHARGVFALMHGYKPEELYEMTREDEGYRAFNISPQQAVHFERVRAGKNKLHHGTKHFPATSA